MTRAVGCYGFSGALALLIVASCGGSVEVNGDTTPGNAGSSGSGASAGSGAAGGSGGVAGHSGNSGSGGASGHAGTGGAGGAGGEAGAAGVGGTSGAAGEAGAAGAGGGMDCIGGLSPIGEPVQIVGESYMNQFNPLLAFAGNDSTRVALAVMEQAEEGPAIPPVNLRFVTLPVWDLWTDAPVELTGTAPFVVGPDLVRMAAGADDGTVAVTYPGNPSPPASEPSVVFFNPAVSASSGTSQVSAASLSQSGDTQRSVFVANNAGLLLIGHQWASNGYWGLDLATSTGTSAPGPIVSSVGCGNQPLVADAARTDVGFIFAFSSNRPFNSCGEGDWNIGLPSRINFGFSGGPGGGFGPLGDAVEVQDDEVGYLQLAQATDSGVWVAYEYMGLNAEVQQPLQLSRFDASGQQIVGPISVIEGFNLVGRPSLTRMGVQPLVAYTPVPTKDTEPHVIRVTLLRQNGNVSAVGEVAAPSSGLPTGEVVAIGHPNSSEVIVAWSQTEGMNKRVYATKFMCVLPD